MNIALWIIQVLLAAFFLTVGTIKVVLPKVKLGKVFEWIDDFSENRIKMIGSFEILGALGLFVPGIYSVSSLIIPLSATGLAIIMVLASIVHYKRNEKSDLTINIVIFFFLAVVVAGRLSI